MYRATFFVLFLAATVTVHGKCEFQEDCCGWGYRDSHTFQCRCDSARYEDDGTPSRSSRLLGVQINGSYAVITCAKSLQDISPNIFIPVRVIIIGLNLVLLTVCIYGIRMMMKRPQGLIPDLPSLALILQLLASFSSLVYNSVDPLSVSNIIPPIARYFFTLLPDGLNACSYLLMLKYFSGMLQVIALQTPVTAPLRAMRCFVCVILAVWVLIILLCSLLRNLTLAFAVASVNTMVSVGYAVWLFVKYRRFLNILNRLPKRISGHITSSGVVILTVFIGTWGFLADEQSARTYSLFYLAIRAGDFLWSCTYLACVLPYHPRQPEEEKDKHQAQLPNKASREKGSDSTDASFLQRNSNHLNRSPDSLMNSYAPKLREKDRVGSPVSAIDLPDEFARFAKRPPAVQLSSLNPNNGDGKQPLSGREKQPLSGREKQPLSGKEKHSASDHKGNEGGKEREMNVNGGGDLREGESELDGLPIIPELTITAGSSKISSADSNNTLNSSNHNSHNDDLRPHLAHTSSLTATTQLTDESYSSAHGPRRQRPDSTTATVNVSTHGGGSHILQDGLSDTSTEYNSHRSRFYHHHHQEFHHHHQRSASRSPTRGNGSHGHGNGNGNGNGSPLNGAGASSRSPFFFPSSRMHGISLPATIDANDNNNNNDNDNNDIDPEINNNNNVERSGSFSLSVCTYEQCTQRHQWEHGDGI